MDKISIDELLALIPQDGSFIGNTKLRGLLQWDEEKFWKVRDYLIEKGKLNIGRGRGGSVALLNPSALGSKLSKELEVDPEIQVRAPENALYDGFRKGVEIWTKDLNVQDYILAIIAHQGRRRTGGIWTRPDVVLIYVSNFTFVPGKILDVITFEIKPSDGWSVESVFETAAHSRFATKSYLAIHDPKGTLGEEDDFERVQAECARFEIGLIKFRIQSDFNTWEFLIEPRRRQPDPAEMEEFIEKQISIDDRKRLSRWVK